jgi:O-antigen/teichoic acid export membrane protein
VNLRYKIFGNAAIYLGANILNAGIPFLLLPILTRVLTPADYGTLAMFGIVLSVFGAFTGLSVHGAIGVRYFQLGKKELAEYVGTCIGILVVSSSVLFLLVALFGPWLTGVSGVPTDWLLVAVVLSGFQFLGNIRLSLWQVAGKAKQYGVFQVSQSLINAGLSLIFILIVGLAWQGRVLGQVFAVGVFGAVALGWLLKDKLLKKSKDWRAQCDDALNFGIPLLPHVIGGLIISTSGQFIATNMFGVAETGLYVIGVQFGSILGIISDAFVKSYGPWLYEKLKNESATSDHFIVGITYYIFLTFILFSAVASIGVFFMFPFVIGHEFLPAKFLVAFFIFGNAFVGMYYAVAGFFFFTSKTKFISIVTVSSGSLSILLMWYLGNMFGIEGIALGYLFSQVIMFLLAWLMSNYVYPLPWLQFRLAFAAVSLVQFKK